VFAVVALLLIAGGNGEAQKAKQVIARLDSVLSNEVVTSQDQLANLLKSQQLSGIPWLNQSLRNLAVGPKLQSLLLQADLKWTAGALLAMCAVGFVFPVYLIASHTGSLLIALPAGLALGFIPLGWVLHKRGQRFKKFEEGLPEALDLMVNGLRAGHSLVAAMGLVARECADPLGREFRACFEEQNYGLELKIAMDNLINRVPLQDLRIVATAILIQKESGGNLAEVLNNTAHVIRERFRLKRQVMVHTAQGRMTGWVLTLLPVGLGIGLYIVNPQMMSILWTRPIGIKLMWGAAGMIVVGGLIIHKITDMDV
jgi:tight adherence protein B